LIVLPLEKYGTIIERMGAPYKTAAIANWFLDRAEQAEKKLDPMKLQKLIYFAHGWFLALANRPLIAEQPQAWNYGPVIPSIYREFKKFGRGPITDRALTIEYPSEDMESILDATFKVAKLDEDPKVAAFLEQIWKVYGDFSGVQLSNISHTVGGAWDKAYKGAGGQRNADISDEVIKEEFEAKRTKSRGSN